MSETSTSRKRKQCSNGEKPSEHKRCFLATRIEMVSCNSKQEASCAVMCPHCDALLSKKTYQKHKRLYYNDANGSWIKETSRDPSSWSSDASCSPLPELPLPSSQSDYECDGGPEHPTYSKCPVDKSGDAYLLEEAESSESESEEIWEDETDVDDDLPPPLGSQPESGCSPEHVRGEHLTRWLIGFLLQLQAKHYIPDSAIDALVKFLYAFFAVLSPFSNVASSILRVFPRSLYAIKTSFGTELDFVRYVVCRKCYCLYRFDECVVTTGDRHSTKHCKHVQYPNHPYRSYRAPCGTSLLHSVQTRRGKRFLHPFKVFCYRSITASLQELLLRPGFFDSCQLWRDRAVTQGLRELYDGKVWKDFQEVNGHPFLALPTGIALMLNIDWFQPYDHTTFSVGVIYAVLMNLPRTVRYKRRNVIIIGIIPGPSEPDGDVNSFLQPFVDELLDLWTGVSMTVRIGSSSARKSIRCALLCCSCDLPAGRKVCGFLGHSACKGCSRCLKEFPGEVGNKDYSGFDRSLWISRTNEKHRSDVQKILACTTKTERARCESELGCRYSALLELPYFDPPRMLSVDPMHNLFLGTAKRMLRIWLEQGIISGKDFIEVQSLADTICVPSDIGRVPLKISSSFSGFTADQYKNWVTIYSIPCLYDLLPSTHLECWRHFVLACRLICKHNLTDTDVALLDALLMRFCTRVEQLYGTSVITPNMHMHGHIKEVIQDFGPVFEFWLFAFERYNGILGKQPTNNRLIEPQLLLRFLRDNFVYNYQFPEEFSQDFLDLLPNQRIVGSCQETYYQPSPSSAEDFVLPSKCSRGVLDSTEVCVLQSLYQQLHHCDIAEVTVCSVFRKYSAITLGSCTYKSTGKMTAKPSIAMAKWDSDLFGTSPTPLPDAATHPTSQSLTRPVNIHHFAKVTFVHGANSSELVFACVSWYSPHPNRRIMGKPAEVWCSKLCETFGIHSFIPLHLISSRCAYCYRLLSHENVLIVVPLI